MVRLTMGDGRPFNARDFAKSLEKQILETAMNEILDQGRNLASSIVDPATGKHPLVFAWRAGLTSVQISTLGSDAYALALEERLAKEGLLSVDGTETEPLVYFAHASEDKDVARPIVEHLLASGVDVWFDQWEITAGDSLRRKMEEGLGNCTHFAVLLTTTSLKKPWVNEEIDAGFVRKVEGSAKFLPLRFGLPLSELPPLLKGMLAPEISSANLPSMQQLVDHILGVSAKPALGPKPRYVQRVGSLGHLSTSAIAVGKALALASKGASFHDPRLDLATLAEATGLSTDDVELGVLDLLEGGMAQERRSSSGIIVWPLGPLFITFDEHTMGWVPADDAKTLAAHMINGGKNQWSPEELSEATGWPKRRMNAALHAVEASNLARTHSFIGGGFVVGRLVVTPQTRRAAQAA